MQHKISFIGAGNMTKAIINGLVASGVSGDLIMASNRSSGKLDDLRNSLGIQTTQNNQQAYDFADIVFLAVKPQMMQQVCEPLSLHSPNKLIVSLAAGLNVSRLQDFLSASSKLVRVMPNTPSLIGMGMSGIFADNNVSAEEVQTVEHIMQCVGKTVVVSQEEQINTVIAAAGSSPAYFFLIAEAMQKASVELGMGASQARELIQQAMLGSAMLMQKQSDLDFATMRSHVTSKGGTTAKAVDCLQSGNIEDLMANAMFAAVERAKQMAEEL